VIAALAENAVVDVAIMKIVDSRKSFAMLMFIKKLLVVDVEVDVEI
jgi:hypothetical protein